MPLTLNRIPAVPRFVRESWQRALSRNLDPAVDAARLALDRSELIEYRQAHPLAPVIPVFERLLFEHARRADLIIAVGDHDGRLLWIDGDPNQIRGAERMLFVEGADWSEGTVGTAAPGTALALDRSVQVRGEEHFLHIVHPWNCTAVPVHDPFTRRVIGVVDVTGGPSAAAPHTLPLLEAAVAAAEAELHVRGLENAAHANRSGQPTLEVAGASLGERAGGTHRPRFALLHVLGRDRALFEVAGASVELSARHSEIMLLLAAYPQGMSAEALAAAVYERPEQTVTLRAEMVRLRRALEAAAPEFSLGSRPYRSNWPIDSDFARVLNLLERGAHRAALASYSGAVLPASTSAAISELRGWVAGRLRDALLSDGSVDALLEYTELPEVADDEDVWLACLQLLPPKSPRRARVVAQIERIRAGVQP